MAAKQASIVRPSQTGQAPQEFVEHPHFEDLPLFGGHVCQCSHANQDRAKLAAKLCQVMQACAVVPKDKANAEQNYKYVSSDAILTKANAAFVDAKLVTVCKIDVLDRQLRTTRSGAVWELVTSKCTLILIDSETGASIESEGIGQGYDSSDKAFSKAQTQSKKYALMLMLNISTGDDPEGCSLGGADEEPIVCKHCGDQADYASIGSYEGQAVKIYRCQKCKKETRVKA